MLLWMLLCGRENKERAYVSRGHERELLGAGSPGPATIGRTCFNSMGEQANSVKRSSPRFASPREPRFFRVKAVADTGRLPGPGSYDY